MEIYVEIIGYFVVQLTKTKVKMRRHETAYHVIKIWWNVLWNHDSSLTFIGEVTVPNHLNAKLVNFYN